MRPRAASAASAGGAGEAEPESARPGFAVDPSAGTQSRMGLGGDGLVLSDETMAVTGEDVLTAKARTASSSSEGKLFGDLQFDGVVGEESSMGLSPTGSAGERGVAASKRLLLGDMTEEEEKADQRINDLLVGKILEREGEGAANLTRKTDELFGDSPVAVAAQQTTEQRSSQVAAELDDTEGLLGALDKLAVEPAPSAAEESKPIAMGVTGTTNDDLFGMMDGGADVVGDASGFNFDEYIQKQSSGAAGGLFS
eukprot:CAMPEP_0118875840 /NCGR_PEP_ID=MMETSP1163-20130328/16768_1 /TAXON_ID=124430 /ORGANISM="Phaeomonas parva, Strain CCMP2877" /LENGTH=253 /DNA_ID=CAMNT_0006811387 /DNA_START=48 /DNA_END=809 /DNA_ORIENTATION=-